MHHQEYYAGPSSILAQHHSQPPKKNRYQPSDLEDADIIALSPTSLMSKNRFTCEVCHKGFPREQNLQLHRRGHDLPWNLKVNGPKQMKRKLFLCPEPSCPHNDPSRALGDLTGLKKHFLRKHGEKKHQCEKCSKKYAVLSDCKAHLKTCGTRAYTCDCGTVFNRFACQRRDSFKSHQIVCDALAREGARNPVNSPSPSIPSGMQLPQQQFYQIPFDSNVNYAASSSYGNFHNSSFVPDNGTNYTSAIDSHKFGFGEVPFGVLPPNQTTEQLPFDSNANEAGPSSFASFHNSSFVPDNGTNYTSATDSHQFGFGEVPFGVLPPNQTTEQLPIDSNANEAGPSTFASFHNSSFFPDNGTNYTSALDSNVNYAASSSYANSLNFGFVPDHGINYTGAIDSHQFGFGEDSFNPFSSGNYYTSEDMQSLCTTLPQAIQNPSTAQMSATALLQNSTQFGSTSSTSPCATNMQRTFVDPYQPNADYFGAYRDNGTGQLQDIVNSVVGGSSSAIYGSTYHDRNSDAQYFTERVNENIAAFDGEGTWFGSLKPDAGPTRDFLGNVGMVEQMVDTSEEIQSLRSTLPQAIQNPSTAQISATSLLQFGSTSFTSPGATNPQQTFVDPYQPNAANSGAFEENGTGYLQDIVNSLPSGSSSYVFGGTYHEGNSDAQYFADRVNENLAAFGGTQFGSSSLPQAIQNPSTAQMSITDLLQNGTQCGSTFFTSPGATNPQQTFVDHHQQNNQNTDYFGTGSGQLQDTVNSVARDYSSSKFGGTYHDRDREAQYFADTVDENIAAFGGEDTWFSKLKPDVGPTGNFLTNVGDVGMNSLDLQAGNTGTSWPSQDFGDPDF